MNLSFGIPSKRVIKEEKYTDIGVLTFMPTGTGMGRKIELNSKALELLNINDSSSQISFSFSGADIYIVNTSGVDNCSGLKVGKTTNGFADKKHYEFIKTKTYNLKEEDTLELFLEETSNEFNGNKVFKLVSNETASLLSTEANSERLLESKDQANELYSDEQVDMLESEEYAKKIEVTSPEQLYNTITE